MISFYPLHDRRLETITHKFGSTTSSTHGYSYDVTGRITEWLQWHNGLTGGGSQFGFGYDGADQLTSAVQRETATGALENLFKYHYDDAGNRTLAQEGGTVRSWTANGYNQLTARAAGGEMEVRGTVNPASTVEVNGQPALMTGPEWSAKLTVQAGENIFPIEATEANVDPGLNAQITEQHLRITVPAGSTTLSYDDNGNLLNDGLRTFMWDAENRLAKVSGPWGVTEFGYDGFDRRVRVVEKQGGAVVSDKRLVWEGMSIVEERDSANVVAKRFFGVGEQRFTTINGQPPTLELYYTTDHLGSIRELVDASGTSRARYDYGLYGRRTKISGNLDADFGFTGHYTHALSSLVLAPFRAYDAELGRWLSRDPIAEEGGINLYGYVENMPGIAFDPDGRQLSLGVNGELAKDFPNLGGLDNATVDKNNNDMEVIVNGYLGMCVDVATLPVGPEKRLATLAKQVGVPVSEVKLASGEKSGFEYLKDKVKGFFKKKGKDAVKDKLEEAAKCPENKPTNQPKPKDPLYKGPIQPSGGL